MERSEKIKKLVKEKGMNLKEFSKKIDIPYTTFHSMLSRGIGNASVDNVIKICQGLGITVEELNNRINDLEKIELTSREKNLIKMYRKLPKERQLAYIGRLELELEQTATKGDINEQVM